MSLHTYGKLWDYAIGSAKHRVTGRYRGYVQTPTGEIVMMESGPDYATPEEAEAAADKALRDAAERDGYMVMGKTPLDIGAN